MQIAVCCTKQWYIYQLTNLYALFKHNKVKKAYLFIEDDEIPYLKDKRIEFINVNTLQEYITKDSPNYNTKYSKLSYLRCYFSKILKCNKILYIDADAIVVNDISDLWNMSFDDKALIGVKEPGNWSKYLNIEDMDDKYINSGVLLMNLKLIREQKLDDEMINLLNTNQYMFPDQDAINIVCKDKIKYVSNIYNSTETTGFVDNAKIIHYIRERKGWIYTSPRSEIWYNYHKEMLGGMKMIKVEVTEDFTLARFGELKNLVRKNKSEQGKLFKGDVFECDDEMAKYLSGDNSLKRPFVKVIEVLPKDISPKDTALESEKIIPLDEENLNEIAKQVNKAVKKSKKSKK